MMMIVDSSQKEKSSWLGHYLLSCWWDHPDRLLKIEDRKREREHRKIDEKI